MPKTAPQPPSEDRVRVLAYQLWLEEGRPEGRAEHHWFKACEMAQQGIVIPDLGIEKQRHRAAARKKST